LRTITPELPGAPTITIPEFVLSDLPNVIRNNVITGNAGTGLVVHGGCRGLHVYNNEFSYNNGTQGSAIRVKAGAQYGAMWEADYLALPDQITVDALDEEGTVTPVTTTTNTGPSLVKDVSIYRNMIFRNGYIKTSSGPQLDKGENAVMVAAEEGAWHGSFENLFILNNTIADNAKYGLAITEEGWTAAVSDEGVVTIKDAGTYFHKNVIVANNIFAGNTGRFEAVSGDGVQVLYRDYLDDGSLQGLFCNLEVSNNYYYGPSVDVVRLQFYSSGTGTTLEYTVSNLQSPVSSIPSCWSSGTAVGSDFADPIFVPGDDDYHIDASLSPCVGGGTHVGGVNHFETGAMLTEGPDYDYSPWITSVRVPDVGADQT